jgi:hypothetical protein
VLEGHGIVTGGPPILLDCKSNEEKKKVVAPQHKKIIKYAWMDDGAKVKVYIDLTDPLYICPISEKQSEVKMEDQSIEAVLKDEQGNTYKFTCAKLFEKIEPEKSSFRIRSNKFIITL